MCSLTPLIALSPELGNTFLKHTLNNEDKYALCSSAYTDTRETANDVDESFLIVFFTCLAWSSDKLIYSLIPFSLSGIMKNP